MNLKHRLTTQKLAIKVSISFLCDCRSEKRDPTILQKNPRLALQNWMSVPVDPVRMAEPAKT